MDVSAFRGYRYNPGVVGDPGLAIAPPYDVIDAGQQEKLYEQSPYNIVRIIKGKADPADGGPDGLSRRAGETLQGFIKAGALKQDAEPSIYVYVQHFEHQEKTYHRSGFIALGKLHQQSREK